MASQTALQMPSTQKRELVIGAGNAAGKRIRLADGDTSYDSPVRLDIDEHCNPDVLWDLNNRPLPFENEAFDEIHAYEVLEHIGTQGDWRGFFAEFEEYYRILKPGGRIFATCPSIRSPWLWGDPGHTRVISQQILTFLSRDEYAKQVGKTAMTDYRHCYSGDFQLLWDDDNGDTYSFVLEKIG